MSKAEIIAGLSHLTPQDLAEVQAKLDELAANAWQDRIHLLVQIGRAEIRRGQSRRDCVDVLYRRLGPSVGNDR